jgi:hypothetical protein
MATSSNNFQVYSIRYTGPIEQSPIPYGDDNLDFYRGKCELQTFSSSKFLELCRSHLMENNEELTVKQLDAERVFLQVKVPSQCPNLRKGYILFIVTQQSKLLSGLSTLLNQHRSELYVESDPNSDLSTLSAWEWSKASCRMHEKSIGNRR